MKTQSRALQLLFLIFACLAPDLAQAKNCQQAGLSEQDQRVCRSYRKIYQLNSQQIDTCSNPLFTEEDRIDCMYSVSKRHMTADQMALCKPRFDYDLSGLTYCLVHIE